MALDQAIEAVLFFRAEPVTIKSLAKILAVAESEIRAALKLLEQKLADRGLKLVFKDEAVMLGTDPAQSPLIEKLFNEELDRDLGRAGLETLAVVVYQGPISRAEVDFIRGVNSSFILRHLAVRGLVEKITDAKDGRRILYRPSFELLSYLGLERMEQLPEYDALRTKAADFLGAGTAAEK